MSPPDDIGDVRDDLSGLKVEVANLRGDLRTGLSDIRGATTNIASSVDHVQRELEQRLTWQGGLLEQHNEAIANLLATINSNKDRAALDASVVRVDLQSQLDAVETGLRRDVAAVEDKLGLRVTTLETWRSEVKGSWRAVAVLSSVLSSVFVGVVVFLITG